VQRSEDGLERDRAASEIGSAWRERQSRVRIEESHTDGEVARNVEMKGFVNGEVVRPSGLTF
jgi:hypothetical protein